jgi:pimeloyl-ACP methyl ester carboxylesterase
MSSISTRLPAPEGPGAGHWLAEQAPEEMLAALTEFLAPYREDGGGLR